MRVSRNPESLDINQLLSTRKSFFPKATIKSEGPVLFRSQVARDLACLFDVDPAVTLWTCDPPSIAISGSHYVSEFFVRDGSGREVLMDAPDRAEAPGPELIAVAAEAAGFRYRRPSMFEIYSGARLRNAKDLLRYGNYEVPLGDRVRLLAALEENGSMTVAECLTAFSETCAVGGLASMILHGFLEIDLDTELIGPSTAVRRIAS